MQEILVYISLFVAIAYLLKKWFFTSAGDQNSCGVDCGKKH